MRRFLVVVPAVFLIGAAQAHADATHTTSTCKTPAGTPASSEGWTQQGSAAAEDSKSLVFMAPANTRRVAYTLWRTIKPSSGPG